MQTHLISHSDFVNTIESICLERVTQLKEQILALSYVKRDRSYFNWEQQRYRSLGMMLVINENILIALDPDYGKMQ